MRVEAIPDEIGMPFKVKAVCLPFVLVEPASGRPRSLELRVCQLARLDRQYTKAPPDVRTKLQPNDPLHWTGAAQNWNHMCASCHSTNVHKNFDVATRSYHTTMSEIDVSCESCHGPGSLHVELARILVSLLRPRTRLRAGKLKGANSHAEIQACAPCHSRRTMISECNGAAQARHGRLSPHLPKAG